VPGARAKAYASTAGFGIVVTDFESAEYIGEVVVGTSFLARVNRSYIEEPSDPVGQNQILIKQYILTNDAESGPEYFISAGVFNQNHTSFPSGKTRYRAFVYTKLGERYQFDALGEFFDVSSMGEGTPDWNQAATSIGMSLAMDQATMCSFHGNLNHQPACPFFYWKFVYNVPQGTFSRLVPYPPISYPVRILSAAHGFYTFDWSAANDIHVIMDDHRYRKLYECPWQPQTPCNPVLDWPISGAGSAIPWKSYSPEATPSDRLSVWQPSTSQFGSWALCSGAAPGTPCGCGRCQYPAWEAINYRWLPERYWPVRWAFDQAAFGTSSTDWHTQVGIAAGEWSNAVGFDVVETTSNGNANLTVTAESEWSGNTGWGIMAEWRPPDLPIQHYQECADRPAGAYVAFAAEPSLQIVFNLEGIDWTPDMTFTTPDFNSGRYRMSMRFIAAHEFGHIFGLGHAGTFPDVMSFPVPAFGYNHYEFTNQYPLGYQGAVACLFYRDWQADNP
jgi:hypothetical protein